MFSKAGVLGAVLLALASAISQPALEPAAQPSRYKRAFESFVEKYGRSYATPAERAQRFHAFVTNLKYIEAENAKGRPYALGLNEYADLTAEEVAAQLGGFSSDALERAWAGLPHLGTLRYSGRKLPAQVDWTEKGVVTPVKSQGVCASCWAFSVAGALESTWRIVTGDSITLSEQQLVDCSGDWNHGCRGGGMAEAFGYLANHALCSAHSYPYSAKDGLCRQDSCTKATPAGAVKGFHDVQRNSTEALMEATTQQPVSVAVEVDQQAFHLYSRGILPQACGSKLRHGVLLVGYGTEGGTDYWKAKNSWGPSWGEDGYFRLKRGLAKDGECGVKDGATYPIVDASTPPTLAPQVGTTLRPGPQTTPANIQMRAAWMTV